MPLVEDRGVHATMQLVGYLGDKRLFIGTQEARRDLDLLRAHRVALAIDTRREQRFNWRCLWAHEPW